MKLKTKELLNLKSKLKTNETYLNDLKEKFNKFKNNIKD